MLWNPGPRGPATGVPVRGRLLVDLGLPVLLAVEHGEVAPLIWLAIVLGVNLGHDSMYGPQAAYFSELFGTQVRYSGASLGYQLASVFAGGLAPLIATALLASSGYTAVAIYMAIMALITVISVILASETFREDILRTRAEERRLITEEPS